MIVGIAHREPAISLERLALQVPSSVAGLAAEHRRRIGQQRFGRLSGTRALEDLGQEAGGKGELVAFAGESNRLQLTERQQAVQIVAPVERALPLDGATASV